MLVSVAEFFDAKFLKKFYKLLILIQMYHSPSDLPTPRTLLDRPSCDT